MSKVIEFPSVAAVADDIGAEAETAEVIDITEEIAARAGIVTPGAALESVQAEVDEVVAVAVVGLLRNGDVATTFSTASPVTLLGMLEIAKDDVLYSAAVDE